MAQLRVHLTGVLGGFGLRKQILGDGTILLVDVHGHSPLATVAHHILQQVLHQTGISGFAGLDQCGDVLEEIVDAFQLVVVHGVVLGELELLESQVLLGHEAGDVQRAEQPAAAGTVLMGGFTVVDDRGEPALQQTGAVIVARHLVHSSGGDGVHRHAIGGSSLEPFAQAGKSLGAQRCDLCHMNAPSLKTSRHPDAGKPGPDAAECICMDMV